MRYPSRYCIIALALACEIFGSPAVADGALPPVEDFFRTPDVTKVAISPDGEHFAMLLQAHDRVGLAVGPSAHPEQMKLILGAQEGDVTEVLWANNSRILFGVGKSSEDPDVLTGFAGTGLFAIDSDGGNLLELITPSYSWGYSPADSLSPHSPLPPNFVFESLLDDDSNNVVVAVWTRMNTTEWWVDNKTPYKLDINTRISSAILSSHPHFITSWLLDPQGQPRIATSYHDGRRVVLYRPGDDETWQELGNFSISSDEGFAPVALGSNGVLYVEQHNDQGYEALYRYDLAKRVISKEPLVEFDGFDFAAHLLIERKSRKLLGLHYVTDAGGTAWLDPEMSAEQKRIDSLLPATVNSIDCTNCLSSNYHLVVATSDRQPSQYLLYSRDSGKLVQVGSSRPWIKPSQMGKREFSRFRARDGRMIPVYYTLPPGPHTAPVPTVVYVHGGPWDREATWEWSAIPQFLASRGYAVVEPQFRGGTGFGHDHFVSGFKQWGLAMQDDLDDSAKWAIEQGIADPKRIGIAGASYGGYATLMGLIRNPDLYKCGFEWVGVSDINLMFDESWSDTTEEAKKYSMTVRIGDRLADAAQLKATSPVTNAERLRQPLLMAYGERDLRVPIEHGKKMRDAVQKNNSNVEWVSYPEEGHGWFLLKDNVDFWTRVEKFLKKNLASAP